METYRVSGMTCGGCVNAVKRAIQRIAPGAEITVELASGKVSVEGTIARSKIQQAVESAGFGFEGTA